MDNGQILKLNRLIAGAYECFSFHEFLKLAILRLHELVAYDSGLFFCGISRDCSFFKPYVSGRVEEYYKKRPFPEGEDYLKEKETAGAGSEALVYRALDYSRGEIAVESEPRSGFLAGQDDFCVACVRIVYQGQFLGEIYLHRSREKPDFDAEDMFVLRLLQPHISTVFHIIHTVTAAGCLETEGGQLSRKGLCLLDGDLSLAGGNVMGLEMLRTTTVFGSSVLYHVKELCEDMWSGVKGPDLLLRTGAGKRITETCLRRSYPQGGQRASGADNFLSSWNSRTGIKTSPNTNLSSPSGRRTLSTGSSRERTTPSSPPP